MIVLFTDFGLEGPYTGQVLAVLQREAPGIPVITLQADAPMGDPFSAAYLLAAYAPAFPAGSVFLCVVDPGVGGARPPLAVQADGAWFVGPGNGLFELVMRRAITVAPFVLTWQPPRLGASFHGRDLFAPVAARLACGAPVPGTAVPRTTLARSDWPEDLPAIVYVDRFGNGMTGLRAAVVDSKAVLLCNGHRLSWARTFSAVPVGTAFWYENANGLVEIAVNQGRAAEALGLKIGTRVVRDPP